jgi:peptidoglycan/xylan/chitin deacetylase (PgdA/CDA1 family)
MDPIRLIDSITYRIPTPLYDFFIPRDLIGLFYHSISDKPQPLIQNIYKIKTKSMFERDLVFIKGNYQPVTYDEILKNTTGEKKIKSNSIHISFDDGLQECFSTARPFLKRYRIPCTFFITTDFIENQSMFFRHKVSLCITRMRESSKDFQNEVNTWINNKFDKDITNQNDFKEWMFSLGSKEIEIIDCVCEKLGIDIDLYLRKNTPYMTCAQIQQLSAEGFTIGAHSMSHKLLSDLPEDEVEAEIVGSCRIIKEITGIDRIPFSFPFYGHKVDPILLENIYENNQEVGLFFDSTSLQVRNPLILDRIWADAPEWDNRKNSNVPSLIKLAYREILLSKLRDAGLYR